MNMKHIHYPSLGGGKLRAIMAAGTFRRSLWVPDGSAQVAGGNGGPFRHWQHQALCSVAHRLAAACCSALASRVSDLCSDSQAMAAASSAHQLLLSPSGTPKMSDGRNDAPRSQPKANSCAAADNVGV